MTPSPANANRLDGRARNTVLLGEGARRLSGGRPNFAHLLLGKEGHAVPLATRYHLRSERGVMVRSRPVRADELPSMLVEMGGSGCQDQIADRVVKRVAVVVVNDHPVRDWPIDALPFDLSAWAPVVRLADLDPRPRPAPLVRVGSDLTDGREIECVSRFELRLGRNLPPLHLRVVTRLGTVLAPVVASPLHLKLFAAVGTRFGHHFGNLIINSPTSMRGVGTMKPAKAKQLILGGAR